VKKRRTKSWKTSTKSLKSLSQSSNKKFPKRRPNLITLLKKKKILTILRSQKVYRSNNLKVMMTMMASKIQLKKISLLKVLKAIVKMRLKKAYISMGRKIQKKKKGKSYLR